VVSLFGFEISRSTKAAQTLTLAQLAERIEGSYNTVSGASVSPATCMRSPTIQAIVSAISKRISTLPIRVMQEVKTSEGRVRQEPQPNHPVMKLLSAPNDWQDQNQFWLDAVSTLVRYGNFVAFKSRGSTGPIRQLLPVLPSGVTVQQDENWDVEYRITAPNGQYRVLTPADVFHVRGPGRDYLWGDSPVIDIREAIALEIQAEQMGGSVFGNAAMPSLVFKFAEGHQGFKTDEERNKFRESIDRVYASMKGRFRSLVLPKGIELDGTPIGVDNDKAQFLATRQYQRTVIAGAFGVPPHMVGDLSKGTFNNVEQQSLDFVQNVVLPYVQMFEAAMEKSLLTVEDRRSGIHIRFDLTGALRGDFKSRQEGLKIQREMGVICPNDWRAIEGLNPLSEEDGGETFWVKGPSGQGENAPTEQPDEPKQPPSDPANDDEEQDAAA
jgi:HK97 family phage portal protein